MSKLPTKEQIKEKYNITEDDFEILTGFPSESEIRQNPSFFEKLNSIPGHDVWKRKSKIGKLISIILIPPTVYAAISFYHPVAQYTYDVGKQIVQNIQWPEENQEIKTIAFLPKKLKLQDTTNEQELEKFPTGTKLYPVSGTMTLG